MSEPKSENRCCHAIAADYYHRVDQGETVDKKQFVNQHADFVQELNEFFEAVGFVENLIAERNESDLEWLRRTVRSSKTP